MVMTDTSHIAGALDRAIENMETAFRYLESSEQNITLPQYRRLKKLRHAFADFLVRSVRVDGEPPPAGGSR